MGLPKTCGQILAVDEHHGAGEISCERNDLIDSHIAMRSFVRRRLQTLIRPRPESALTWIQFYLKMFFGIFTWTPYTGRSTS